ncbi:hypothetical protein L9F63_026719, partial [Diploptera punctata]
YFQQFTTIFTYYLTIISICVSMIFNYIRSMKTWQPFDFNVYSKKNKVYFKITERTIYFGRCVLSQTRLLFTQGRTRITRIAISNFLFRKDCNWRIGGRSMDGQRGIGVWLRQLP